MFHYYTLKEDDLFMKFLVTAHSNTELDKLTSTLSEAEPEAKILSTDDFNEALKMIQDSEFDVAVIDPDGKTEIPSETLASEIKAKRQNTHIIFVSSNNKHMPEAFRVHADAYLLKPVKPEDVKKEMEYMMNRYPTPLRLMEITVRTFGGFNVYVHGKKLHFKRNKAKELLAILVDNRGVGLSTREVCAMLFGGRKYDEILLGYYHVVLTSLKITLEEAGVKNLIRKSINYISIDPERIDCDMYRYLRGEEEFVKDYHGDYMSCYNWSEFSSAKFEEIAREERKKERAKKNLKDDGTE